MVECVLLVGNKELQSFQIEIFWMEHFYPKGVIVVVAQAQHHQQTVENRLSNLLEGIDGQCKLYKKGSSAILWEVLGIIKQHGYMKCYLT